MGSYDLQREKHAKNRDTVLRVIGDDKHRFGEICDASDLTKSTVSSILSELEKERLLAKDGTGRETRYSLTNTSFEALKLDTSAFRVIKDAYDRWHPSMKNPQAGANLVIGSYAFPPIIETGSLLEAVRNEGNGPLSPFIDASKTEGAVQAAVMQVLLLSDDSQSMKGGTEGRGKLYMVVTVDFDQAYEYYARAAELSYALARGDTLSLFFLNFLNVDTANDPMAAEIEKTLGPLVVSSLVDLNMRQESALTIAMSRFPILLKMMLSGKTAEETQTILRTIGWNIDGVFSEIIDIYESAHGGFLHRWQDAEGSNLHNEAIAYLESMGVDRIDSTAIQEIQAVLLLLYLKEGHISAAKVMLTTFGVPFLATGDRVRAALNVKE